MCVCVRAGGGHACVRGKKPIFNEKKNFSGGRICLSSSSPIPGDGIVRCLSSHQVTVAIHSVSSQWVWSGCGYG